MADGLASKLQRTGRKVKHIRDVQFRRVMPRPSKDMVQASGDLLYLHHHGNFGHIQI